MATLGAGTGAGAAVAPRVTELTSSPTPASKIVTRLSHKPLFRATGEVSAACGKYLTTGAKFSVTGDNGNIATPIISQTVI